MSLTSGTSREKIIVRTGLIGIAANLLLVAFKAAVGLAANAVAIVLDAVNNLTDVLSSVITVAGTKLSARPADREHPMGHGRIEYLTAMLIAVLILFAGAASLLESVRKILHPQEVSFSPPQLVILAAAVLVKIVLGGYTKKQGRNTGSEALKASGADALFDAAVSTATLIGAAASLIWGINLDGWIGIAISAVILRTGVGVLSRSLNDIIGIRVDGSLSKAVRDEILTFGGVLGVYDMFLDSYGPSRLAGSVHLEVADDMPAIEIDRLTRCISADIYGKFGILITCGIYAVNVHDPGAVSLRRDITERMLAHAGVLQVHGLRIDEAERHISFDVVRDFSVKDVPALIGELQRELSEAHPEYTYTIVPDLNYTD